MAAKQGKPDVAIVDITMPILDGLEHCTLTGLGVRYQSAGKSKWKFLLSITLGLEIEAVQQTGIPHLKYLE
jgi:DNA-binding NarL/FixJ family response regulator